jgi:hypothetical protein
VSKKTRKLEKQARMTSQPAPLDETEEQRVYVWRLRTLESEGIPRSHAKKLADHSCDLHAVVATYKRGCSPDLLLDIYM